MNRNRVVLAIAISPWVPVGFMGAAGFWSESFQWNFFIVGLAVVVGYISLLFIGVPLVFVLHRLEILGLVWLVLSGTAMGLAVWNLCLLLLGYLLDSSAQFGSDSAIFGGIMGFVLSLSFGLIAGITKQSSRTA